MRKFFGLTAIFAALFVLALAGCSNSAAGGTGGATIQTAGGGITPGCGKTPGGAYEETLTIDLSADSDKLSAAGAASLVAGTDVSEWFSDTTVSRSVADGFTGFKAVIVSATETKLVIKVTGTAATKKCTVTLSITIPATVTASGQPVVKANVKTVGIGVEPEVLQTEHVKIEKVSGGLKFTITRPSDDCYNPDKGGGWGYTSISSDGMTFVIDNENKKVVECFYPMVKPGKQYEFHLSTEPSNRDLRQFCKYESLSVIAADGKGDVDFSNSSKDGYVDVTYDGTKPILTLKNYKAPDNVTIVQTVFQYFATNQSELKDGHVDWDTPNALVWLDQYEAEGAVYECAVDPLANKGGIIAALAAKEKDTLYAFCFFNFDVPEATGFSQFRTPAIEGLKKIR